MPWSETETQRFLTIDLISKGKLNVPAIWLKSQGSDSSPEDAVKPPTGLNTDLALWREQDDERNLGVRLVDGHIELRIRAPDDVWVRCFFEACKTLGVDARAAYGTKSKPISSIILRIEDAKSIERWRDRWPRGWKGKHDEWIEAPFVYSFPPTVKGGKSEWLNSRPLPGSKYAGGLVVWRPWGKPSVEDAELGLEDWEAHRELDATDMESVCRAIAFASLAYWILGYLDGLTEWDETLTRAIGGWIARLIREGADINARGKSLEGICWSPIDSEDTARLLLKFLGNKHLDVAFAHADAALERNPTSPVAGWGMIETLFGPTGKIAIRRAFRAGLDLDRIEQLSDQYAYDLSSHTYLDRDAILKGLAVEHGHDDMLRNFQNQLIPIGRKWHNPFQLYSQSSLRVDVEHREFRPGHQPAAVLRYSPLHGILNGEDRRPDEYRILNVFPGFLIKPVAVIDVAILKSALSMLDRMLGLLTRDNDDQILWLKKFIAWIAQKPEIKAQVCPIIVGGQGIGKSLFGNILMKALFGDMAGQATASALSENKFFITPFLGKLITFIDEVRLESVGAINAIKTLVRSDRMSGEKKFKDQGDHYVPSRLLIASNQPSIGLTPEDAADRAFFFVIAWTAENKRMTDREFQTWSLTLKPFYDEFVRALESVAFKQHLMRYFMDLEVTRAELEDLRYSSRDDENVVRSTMSKAREIARHIVADARVNSGQDITAWFTEFQLRDAIKRWDDRRNKAEVSQVLMEFERAGVLEKMSGNYYRFRYGYGRLLQKMSDAHGLKLEPAWPVDSVGQDWEDNHVDTQFGELSWRGNKQRSKHHPRSAPPPPEPDPGYDPDAMPAF